MSGSHTSESGHDPIDEALMRSPTIDDAGFTDLVMARLPPSRPRLRAVVLLVSCGAAAAVAALVLPGAARSIAAAAAGLSAAAIAPWAAPLALAAIALLFGELTWAEGE